MYYFGKEYELVSIEDVYENDEIVITKPFFSDGINNILCVDVGIKNKDGDIVDIKAIDYKMITNDNKGETVSK
ncbi:MAG: hypothetical protein LUG95_08050 [Clostridiales bacterium]|nr:hypothetical protein [Clostridiales bacterium]